jgi:hypothetical protein
MMIWRQLAGVFAPVSGHRQAVSDSKADMKAGD